MESGYGARKAGGNGGTPVKNEPTSTREPEADATPIGSEDTRGTSEPKASEDLRLAEIQTRLDELVESVGLFPGKMRNLSREINAVTKSVSDSRLSELLTRLVQFSDLLDGLVDNGPDTSPAAGERAVETYTVLRNQMRQILKLSGLKETSPEPGTAFDPLHHRAKARVPTTSADRDQTIHEVQRPGFECGDYILRYPEVSVYAFQPQPASKPGGKKAKERQPAKRKAQAAKA